MSDFINEIIDVRDPESSLQYVLCCAVPCRAVLCCGVLCFAVLYGVLYSALLCAAML